MSAVGGNAEIIAEGRNFGFVPKGDIPLYSLGARALFVDTCGDEGIG
jgi:hypothetical protein